MKHQALFSSEDKVKKIKVSSAAIFIWRFKGYYRASSKCLQIDDLCGSYTR